MARSASRFRIDPKFLGGFTRALSSRNYRFYAAGHIAHVHGWWGNRMGLGWMTWELTNSPAWLGLIAFAVSIPVMLVGPVAGAIADRYGHRRVAVASGICGSFVSLTIGVTALTGHVTVGILMALAVLQGSLFGFEFPSRQALIPQLVGRSNISAAVAFNATTFQLGTFVGPVLAGVVIVHFGGGGAVLMYWASTLWMAGMLSLIRQAPESTGGAAVSGARSGLLSDMADGFRYLVHEPSLRVIFVLMLSVGIMVRPLAELMPGFADDVFGRGAEGLAALNASAGFGAMIAAVFLVFRGRTKGLVTIMLAGCILGSLFMLAFTTTDIFALGMITVALASAGFLAGQVGWQSLVQNIAAPAMRGRVISIHAAIAVGSPALGALFVGWLASLLGLQVAVALAAVTALVMTSSVIPVMRRLRSRMEADPGE